MTYVNGVKALAMHNKVGKKRKLVPRNVKDAYIRYLKKYGKLGEVEKYEKYLEENDVPRSVLQQYKNMKESI